MSSQPSTQNREPTQDSLRDDLARFTFLLGESDGEGLFSPTPE